jgi:hypothetical protein
MYPIQNAQRGDTAQKGTRMMDPKVAEAKLMARTMSLIYQAMDMDWEREPDPFKDEQALEDRYRSRTNG